VISARSIKVLIAMGILQVKISHCRSILGNRKPTIPLDLSHERGPNMLVISRGVNDSFVIGLSNDTDPTLTIADLFAKGPIEVRLLGMTKKRFKIGISAPTELFIRRIDEGFARLVEDPLGQLNCLLPTETEE
jgi:sRNA-binding carbon storage regulator CsrA